MIGFRFNFHVPWFMYDLDNRQLITTKTIPGDITDSKQIVLTETPIPGLNYAPVMPGGGGNRKISFTLPLIRRDALLGNVAMLKQFDQLRNQVKGIGALLGKQFNPMPRVLYYWGTGSVPLVYWVAKADATHKAGWVNAAGQPQYSEIELELWLDETDPLYIAEELFRSVSAQLGQVQGIAESGLDILRLLRTY